MVSFFSTKPNDVTNKIYIMIKIYKKIILSCVAIMLVGAANLSAQNLLGNPSFETGVLAPWVAGNMNVVTIEDDAQSGNFAARGNIEQFVDLEVGANYTYTAYAKCLFDCDVNKWIGIRDEARDFPATNFNFSTFNEYGLCTVQFTAQGTGATNSYKIWVFGQGEDDSYITDNTLLLKEGTTSVYDEEEAKKIQIHNFQGGVKVSIEDFANDARIDIHDLSGQLMYRKMAANGDVVLSNSEFRASGMYVVSVHTSKTRKVGKVMITK